MLTGCLLFVSDKMTPGTKTEKTMRIRDAIIIGCCQCVATIPGLSRSGTTITAGIATGWTQLRHALLLPAQHTRRIGREHTLHRRCNCHGL